MRIRVLGSAAGGGFPQWNCGCPNCDGLRRGSILASPRRQESVAVSADGQTWTLLNASPEIREQFESFPLLWPQQRRHSPVGGIVLTNGDLDHVLGLLSLRESHPLILYATDSVRRGFTEGNVLFRTLQRFEGQVTWRRLTLGVEGPLGGGGDHAGPPSGLTVTPFAVPGKRPIHLELGATRPPSEEDNIGLLISAPGAGGVARTLAYVPAVAAWTDDIQRRVSQADAVFFDGTFWSSAELSDTGVGTKRAEDMAHLPLAGPDGGLARLAAVGAARRVLIHINNTNPILRDDSPERSQVEAAGVEVAFDGMELTL